MNLTKAHAKLFFIACLIIGVAAGLTFSMAIILAPVDKSIVCSDIINYYETNCSCPTGEMPSAYMEYIIEKANITIK